MNDKRKNMLNRMIKIYGEKHSIIDSFITLISAWEENNWNDECLRVLVEAHEANPYRK